MPIRQVNYRGSWFDAGITSNRISPMAINACLLCSYWIMTASLRLPVIPFVSTTTKIGNGFEQRYLHIFFAPTRPPSVLPILTKRSLTLGLLFPRQSDRMPIAVDEKRPCPDFYRHRLTVNGSWSLTVRTPTNRATAILPFFGRSTIHLLILT